METIMGVLTVAAPIFTAIVLGAYARRRQLISREGNEGLRQFVMKFGLPCVLFNSCLTADFGAESVLSMALVLPPLCLSTLWAYRARRKRFPYHNLPMLFAAQETGMLGIPLFVTLFGAGEAYRVGILNVAQAPLAISTIAILAAPPMEKPSRSAIAGQVVRSPLLVMALLGLGLNLTGAAAALDRVGALSILTAVTGFLAQPVSAVILFSVGYSFSLGAEARQAVARISVIHFVLFSVYCLVIQGVLCLLPSVEALTRWAMLLYCFLPGSFVAPGLGRTEEDAAMASGVCSVLTVISLLMFCVIAALTA
ncbi:AEC family transporter [Dysosmobacter sp.]|uniref:AEC family transporter n=1 Tax=Dysosmobacter sp. TaxID=2591382 RepID=UPI002A889755|nr:AEC family transporter [Dysosmobacter sp.]MDY3280852.1 AEC family transporter [Dysosmobacter sp.]